VTYKVRCTTGIANEMARYECNEIKKVENPQCDEKWVGDEYLEEAYTTYEFTIAGTPNIDRWKSFGVTVDAGGAK